MNPAALVGAHRSMAPSFYCTTQPIAFQRVRTSRRPSPPPASLSFAQASWNRRPRLRFEPGSVDGTHHTLLRFDERALVRAGSVPALLGLLDERSALT